MKRRLAAIAALLIGVAVLLVFVAGRIGDRDRISETGTTVLMPLAPLGPRDLALGDRIELVFELPEVESELRAGTWPGEGALRVTLDEAGTVRTAALHEPSTPNGREVVVNYRFASSGLGLWPTDRPRLLFGDSFYLVTEGQAADYLNARYAVLKVNETGSSVVIGLADGRGNLIRPDAIAR